MAVDPDRIPVEARFFLNPRKAHWQKRNAVKLCSGSPRAQLREGAVCALCVHYCTEHRVQCTQYTVFAILKEAEA